MLDLGDLKTLSCVLYLNDGHNEKGDPDGQQDPGCEFHWYTSRFTGNDVIEMYLTKENIKKDQDHPEYNNGYHQEVDPGSDDVTGSTASPWTPSRGSPQCYHGEKDSSSSE